MNTPRPLSVRPIGAKAALALRMGRIGENGKRAGEKAFDNGSRKPMLLALGAVALIPIEAISPQSHRSRKDRQLYRQMSRHKDGSSLTL
jgi:hypothetical protein